MTLYYKVLTSEMCHRGFQYQEGLNVDNQKFNPSGSCEGGGLYYTDLENLGIFLAAVQQDECALDYVKGQTSEVCLAAVQKGGYMLEYVEEQTPEICLAAVNQDGLALEFVKVQTRQICTAAVNQDGRALQYVKIDLGVAV